METTNNLRKRLRRKRSKQSKLKSQRKDSQPRKRLKEEEIVVDIIEAPQEEEEEESENDNEGFVSEDDEEQNKQKSSEEENDINDSEDSEDEDEDEDEEEKAKNEDGDEEENYDEEEENEDEDDEENEEEEDEEEEEEEENGEDRKYKHGKAVREKPNHFEKERTVYDSERTVFVGNLGKKATSENITALFSACGQVSRINMLHYNDTGKFQGACFVEFAEKKSARKALKMNGVEFLGMSLKVNAGKAKPKKTNRKGELKKADDNATVYVGNLSFGTDETSLRNYFGQCGKIVRVNLPLWHSTGRRRSFAMIEYVTSQCAKNALSFDGKVLDGRELRVGMYTRRENGNGVWKGNLAPKKRRFPMKGKQQKGKMKQNDRKMNLFE